MAEPAVGSLETLAKELLSRCGISHGIASLPHCGDGQLALAIVRSSGMLVHTLDADRKNVDALAKQADAAGLLARRLYAETGSAETLPYADNLVDLVLFSDLADGDLAGLSAKETMRVLSPFRGAALFGRPKPLAADGKLTKAALEAWVKSQGLAGAQVWSDETGVWAMVRKPTPAGLEGWTHRYHGANNNPVSADATIKGPLLTQWMGLPQHDGWWGTTIVSDSGRVFTIAAASFWAPNFKLRLTARSLHNSSLLWERVLTANLMVKNRNNKIEQTNYNPARSCMIAAGEKLYLIDGDGVLTLDAETGAELGRIAGPKAGGQIKWLTLADGILAMLAGEPDEMKIINYMTFTANPSGSILAVYDLASSRELWHRQEKSPVDERMITIQTTENSFAHSADTVAFCLDLKTGKLLWTNSDPSLLETVGHLDSDMVQQAILSQRGLIATDQGIILGIRWMENMVVLSPQTGSVLWNIPIAKYSRTINGFVMDGKWWSSAGPMDMSTGKTVGKDIPVTNGCGPTRAAPGLQVGAFGTVKDTATGKVIAHSEVKAPCDMGTVISEGIILTPPSVCRCNMENWGYLALATGPGFGPDKIPDASSRLVAGSKEPPAPLAVTLADWPTYRANTARSGATTVKVAQVAPEERWRWSPAKPVEFEPSSLSEVSRIQTTANTQFAATPPIAAAGKVWLGDASGVVRCLDGTSGKQLWSFAAGAGLFAPPTVADGRLFFGSGDGWVYGLDASSGRELWRFRAAPFERRYMWFGHLNSTWPVITGVLVHDGIAYAAAGYEGLNGVYTYALDATSGQVRWEDRGTVRERGSVGTMTIANGRLWTATGIDWLVSFDLKTGRVFQNCHGDPLRGCEIGAFADRFILYGGRRLISGYDERKVLDPFGGIGFAFASLKDESPMRREVVALPDSTLPPVWDAELTVVARGQNSLLTGWNSSKLVAFLDETMPQKEKNTRAAPPQLASPLRQRPLPKTASVPASAPAPAPLPMFSWGPIKQEFNATVLAANALLATQGVPAREPNALPTWQLTALDRKNGETLWAVPLPCEPIFNSMCVDRDGRIFVVLRDGSLACYEK